jgi:class 3 adenylate cyclase
MRPMSERGTQDRVSLRFRDDELEERYQREAGRESQAGFRAIATVSCVGWAMAAVLLPIATDLVPELAVPVSLGMAVVSLVAVLLTRWATTLDRQHRIASLLTIGNGLVILTLATAGGILPGYGVSAVMLLLMWGFVARTRFVYAAFRGAVLAIGFLVAAAIHTGPPLVLDAFFFIMALTGNLLALRILERTRRGLFHRDLVIHEQADELEREKEKSDRLLRNVLPASISARLREGEARVADAYPSVTVLFADIVDFTPLAARLSAADVVDLLSGLFSAFDDLADERGIEKIKTVGDTYMAAGGLPEPVADHAVRVVDLGLAMLREAARPHGDLPPVRLRIGVHSGPAVGGVIGSRKFAFDVWGDTVNVASRLEAQGVPDRVHVSDTTRRLVGDRFAWEACGSIELRGHGAMETFFVVDDHAGRE